MYDFRARSDSAKLFFEEPSMCKQEFEPACNINNILKKYVKNGVNPFVITQDAKYGDFSDMPSFQEAFDYVESATGAFMDLPAKLRSRFNNDPGQLLNFLQDPSNLDEAVFLGLVEQKIDIDQKNNSPAGPVISAPEGASKP